MKKLPSSDLLQKYATIFALGGILLGSFAHAESVSIPSETPFNLSLGKTSNTRLEPADDGVRITFPPNSTYPGITWTSDSPMDWSGVAQIGITVTNESATTTELYFILKDVAGKELYAGFSGPHIASGETFQILIDLTRGTEHDSKNVYGMNDSPPVVSGDYVWMAERNAAKINLKQVASLKIFMHKSPPESVIFHIQNLKIYKPSPLQSLYTAIVDPFGQYTRASWPGKIKSDSDFPIRLKEETEDLAANPRMPDRDEYGAWTKGPKGNATGFFHATNLNGRWWLVAPNGNLFLSFGFNSMWPGGNPDKTTMDTPTVTSGREYMFQSIPKDVHASKSGFRYGPFTGPVATYDFYGSNVDKKYGAQYGSGDYVTGWNEQTLKRMQSWGFNTIANWSDNTATSLQAQRKLPYTVTLHSKSPIKIGRIPDPYDPSFEKETDTVFQKLITPEIAKDPWCLGYFCDNEIPWTKTFPQWPDYETNIKNRYSLAIAVLGAAATQPAKIAWQGRLQKQYETIVALNTAWGAQFTSWEDWLKPSALPSKPSEALVKDLASFTEDYAAQYASTIKTLIKKYDPNHLYFGCRFSFTSPDMIRGMAREGGVDVISFNIYSKTVDRTTWAIINTLNKPSIISEYHFGAQDRGMFGYGNGTAVRTRTQQERAEQYKDYMKSLLEMPALVGAHWFQYTDEPLTGRNFDGEDYNIGFVDVADTPYAEMVKAAREIHQQAYPLHEQSK